ncbi:MAG: dTDP-4-dehydrorhamnose 3,5-epimerase family protein [Bacilli bacterium]
MQKFSFKPLPLQGAYLIKPFFAGDLRGGFIKDYSLSTFQENGINYELKEVFYTLSHRGVMRALHLQEVNHQPKLVRCISGKIFDVIVDLRPESPTFKQWMGFYLTGENMDSLLIPAHFAHGYLVLEDSIVSYKCAAPFDGPNDSGIMYDDPDLNVAWPFDEIGGKENLILSEKDKKLQSFKEYFAKGCK